MFQYVEICYYIFNVIVQYGIVFQLFNYLLWKQCVNIVDLFRGGEI